MAEDAKFSTFLLNQMDRGEDGKKKEEEEEEVRYWVAPQGQSSWRGLGEVR